MRHILSTSEQNVMKFLQIIKKGSLFTYQIPTKAGAITVV